MQSNFEQIELGGSKRRSNEYISKRVVFFGAKVAKGASYVKLPRKN